MLKPGAAAWVLVSLTNCCLGGNRQQGERLFARATKVLKRQPFEKHRKVVLNLGAGESNDEVKQQRIATLVFACARSRARLLASPRAPQHMCPDRDAAAPL